MQAYQNQCLGVVLAGGLSSRMGKDKALLTRQDQNMLSFSEHLLRQAGIEQVVISGKQHGIADEIEQLGPMGGIYTIINKYQPSALLILPVDLPLMDSKTLQQLKLVGELSKQPSYYQGNYLPLYLPVNALVQQFFQQQFSTLSRTTDGAGSIKHAKGPSIKALLTQLPCQQLALKNTSCLFNSNTPEQWQQAQQQLSKHRSTHV